MSHEQQFQECLKQAKRVVALVGAGLSAGSGLPIFRGSQPLWNNFNMIDLATPDAFYIDPGLVWQFYAWKRWQAMQAQPNAGHYALAQFSHNPNYDFITITQNDDDLHQRAGHDPNNLHEVQGSFFQLKCTSFTCTYSERNRGNLTKALDKGVDRERRRGVNDEREKRGRKEEGRKEEGSGIKENDGILMNGEEDIISEELICEGFGEVGEGERGMVQALEVEQLPQCPECGTLMRPGVVWFGEPLPVRVLDEIDEFLQLGVDLILVVGTSCSVYPANSYVDLVRLRGGSVAVFNTEIEDDVLRGDVPRTWGFVGDAADTLPRLLDI